MSRRETSQWAGQSLESLRERWGRDSIHLYGKIDSTNEAAGELADAGAPAGTLVLAREQTAGRGRSGNAWHSPRDAGLYMSLICRPEELPRPALVAILAALGIAQRLDRLFPGLRPAVKWPNDLIAGGRKVGGILAEAAWSGRRPRHLVVGVGINIRPLADDLPTDLADRATALESVAGEGVSPVEVADCALLGIEDYLPAVPETLEGALLEQVDRFDWLRDRRARLTPPGEETSQPGTCVGIAPDGALLFRPDRGALRRVTDAVVDPWA